MIIKPLVGNDLGDLLNHDFVDFQSRHMNSKDIALNITEEVTFSGNISN